MMNALAPTAVRLLGLYGLLAAAAISGCQQGSRPSNDLSQADDPLPHAKPLGAPGDTAYAHLQDYLAVVRDPSRFNECLTQDPLGQPHLCMLGPRTGSLSGKAVHQWMLHQLKNIQGLEQVSQQHFSWPRFAPKNYALEVADPTGAAFKPASYPWHFQGVTGPQGVSGELVNLMDGSLLQRTLAGSLQGKIAMLGSFEHVSADEEDAERKINALIRAGAAGLIYTLPGPENDIIAQNYDAALGLNKMPTLIVGRHDRKRLVALEGQQASMVVEGAVEQSQSYNTYAFIPGQDRSRMIVVGTPMNAWFQAASERGPGIGGFIYLARYFADQARRHGPPPVTLAFVATGAHETMGFGLERALRCLDPARVTAYVHLGTGLASIGYDEEDGALYETGKSSARRWIVVSENPEAKKIATQGFAEVMQEQGIETVRAGGFNRSESQVAYAMNIPTVGMTGGGWFHHSPRDDETRLSVEYLDPVILAFRKVTQALLHADADALAQNNLVAGALAGLRDLPGYSCPSPVSIP